MRSESVLQTDYGKKKVLGAENRKYHPCESTNPWFYSIKLEIPAFAGMTSHLHYSTTPKFHSSNKMESTHIQDIDREMQY